MKYVVNVKEFELLKKRKREILELKNEIKDLKLDELWACKNMNKTHERVMKDPLYSDFKWFEGSVVYTVIQPPYKFDFLSPSKFKVIGKARDVEIKWRKQPLDYWETEWEMLYDLYVSDSDKNFIPFPPEFVGKDAIIKSIDETIELVEYKPPEYFMKSINGGSFGEKVYSAILNKKVIIRPNNKSEIQEMGKGIFLIGDLNE